MGWTRNRSDDPRNDVTTNSATTARPPVESGEVRSSPASGGADLAVASAAGPTVTVIGRLLTIARESIGATTTILSRPLPFEG
jgi:hypothetical protein